MAPGLGLALSNRRYRRRNAATSRNEGNGTITVSRVQVDGEPYHETVEHCEMVEQLDKLTGRGTLFAQRGMVMVELEGKENKDHSETFSCR